MTRVHPFAVLTDGIVAEPGVASWGLDRADVIAVEASGCLRHLVLTEAGNGQDVLPELPTAPVGAPVVISWGRGRLDVFIRDSGGDLLHSWWEGAWQPWRVVGASTAAPTVVSWGPGRFDLFVRTQEASLAHYWYSRGPGMQGPEDCGGSFAGRPSAATTSLYGIHMVARGQADGLLRYQYALPRQRSHEWTTSTWQPGRGAFHTSPPVTPDGCEPLACTSDPVLLPCRGEGRVPGRLLAYARRDDTLLCLEPQLWQHRPADRVLGAGIASDACATSAAPRRADVFVRLRSGAIGHLTQWLGETGDAGLRWESLDDGHVRAGSRPAVISSRTGRLDLFFRGDGGELCHGWREPGTTDWNDRAARRLGGGPG
ncbi:hypothetical protein AB0C33_35910 [Nonomuraea sp. NPDC048881]|uniref:hypothetical protein n=1 Tax=Nonomuraea sp. NPDC048881 TaxID=3155030 RepID=UPI0033D9AD5A